MSIQISIRETQSIVTKSKLPDADYVINPYLGCPHGCIYCYAEFMKRFSQHSEPWGSFLEVKQFAGRLDCHKYLNTETILIGSVTDAYNPFEGKYRVTRSLLSQLVDCVARIEILTKSSLVCRDIDLLTKMPNVAVGISMNTTDDSFRREIEPFAVSVKDRIETLQILKKAGIATYLFVAPFFPGITDYQNLLNATAEYIDYACFENLNLRGSYRGRVLSMIAQEHTSKYSLYESIYYNKDQAYWTILEKEITQYCSDLQIPCRMYFHHGAFGKQTERK